MKRSNFTFLFLFALLSFVSTNLSAQSTCTDANVVVQDDCMVQISSTIATGDSIYLKADGFSGSGTSVSGGFYSFGKLEEGVYTYEAHTTISGSGFCWGTITIEYKTAPTAISTIDTICCAEDVVFPTFVLDSVINGTCVQTPTDIASLAVTEPGLICDTILHIRTTTGTVSLHGTPSTITLQVDTIVEIPLNFGDVNMPDLEVEIECGDYDDLSPSGVYAYLLSIATTEQDTLDADDAAWPYVQKTDTTRIILKDNGDDEQTVCNLNTKCSDMELTGECGLPVIMRSWTVTNWCDAKTSVLDSVQWIKVVDTEAPILDLDASTTGAQDSADVSLDLAPWSCDASVTASVTTESCADVTYEWFLDGASLGAGSSSKTYSSITEPITITVIARNVCNGLKDTATWNITVEDVTPPVMISEDQLIVSLADFDGGVSKVYAADIDAGSHDAGCGDVETCILLKAELENPIIDPYTGDVVSGQYTPAGSCEVEVFTGTHVGVADKFGVVPTTSYSYVLCRDAVKLCCADLGDNTVALVGEDADGNSSHTWTTITVEDKSEASWADPGNTFDCTTTDAVVEADDTPTYSGVICDVFTVEECGRVVEEDGCGDGTVTITWCAKDADGVTVSTYDGEYDITNDNPFRPETILWPVHYTGESASALNLECVSGSVFTTTVDVDLPEALECDGEVTDEPVWCDETCSILVYSYEDLTLEADDVCQKIIRTHTVIDWCSYTPNSGAEDYDDFDLVSSWLDGTTCVDCDYATDEPLPSLYYQFDSYDADGYYKFDQIIKIIDKDAPTITVADSVEVAIIDGATAKGDVTVCTGEEDVTATAADVCMGSENDPSTLLWYVTVEAVGANGSRTLAEEYSFSGPTATVSTEEGGETSLHVITWTCKDACGNTIVTETTVTFADKKNPTPVCLQDISTATMNVDGSSVAIWASDYDLGSFDNCGDVDVYFKDSDGDAVSSLSFGCDDIANGISATQELQLFVADESGNEDFCYVTLRIDDNADICEDVDSGASAISGEVSTELGDMIESAEVSLNKVNTDMTSVEGKYAFGSNPAYSAYEITAKKDDDYLNGVTTLDLVLIQKHVLGIEALDSPYKVIAADINSDANVSAIDLVELRKLILGVYNTLPSNDSWRFIDATETFADANDPFPFTEALNIAELNGDALNQDFLGIKVGDVSGNAIANSLIAAGTRSAGTLNIEIADATVDAGQVISVPVSAANFSDIAAYQFTMDVNKLEFTGVESGAINVSADNFGLIDANTITTAWNSTAGVSASDVLFTMNFRATADVTLSEAISVSSRVTTAAAYTANADQLDVNVSFNGVATTEFALFQNEPNPFENVTRIAFELPQAASATLTVFDVTGKVVSIVRGDFAQGVNTITLDKSDLNASGVMYYQLESGEFTATKKMIVIE